MTVRKLDRIISTTHCLSNNLLDAWRIENAWPWSVIKRLELRFAATFLSTRMERVPYNSVSISNKTLLKYRVQNGNSNRSQTGQKEYAFCGFRTSMKLLGLALPSNPSEFMSWLFSESCNMAKKTNYMCSTVMKVKYFQEKGKQRVLGEGLSQQKSIFQHHLHLISFPIYWLSCCRYRQKNDD